MPAMMMMMLAATMIDVTRAGADLTDAAPPHPILQQAPRAPGSCILCCGVPVHSCTAAVVHAEGASVTQRQTLAIAIGRREIGMCDLM
jgi:hypothetical protein